MHILVGLKRLIDMEQGYSIHQIGQKKSAQG